MARKYKPSTPAVRSDFKHPPMTTPGNVRAFDARPKAGDHARQWGAPSQVPRSSEPQPDNDSQFGK